MPAREQNMSKYYEQFAELIDKQEPIFIGDFWPQLKEILEQREHLPLKDREDIDAIIDLIVYEDPNEI